jgi:hypothetical protein
VGKSAVLRRLRPRVVAGRRVCAGLRLGRRHRDPRPAAAETAASCSTGSP